MCSILCILMYFEMLVIIIIMVSVSIRLVNVIMVV